MEFIDLFIFKNFRKGDKDLVIFSEVKKFEQEVGSSGYFFFCLVFGFFFFVILGFSGILESFMVFVLVVILEFLVQFLQGFVQLVVLIYFLVLVSSFFFVGSLVFLSGIVLLWLLWFKFFLFLLKFFVIEELFLLVFIVQIILFVFLVFIFLKIKVVDLGLVSIGSNIMVLDSLGGCVFKVVIIVIFVVIISLKEFSEFFVLVSSLEVVFFIEQGLVGILKKRGRKRGVRSWFCVNSVGVDLDFSGEFVSIEKMLVIMDINKFSLFLQIVEDNIQDEVVVVFVDYYGFSDEEQGSFLEDKLLRIKWNLYINCLQKIICFYCFWVFFWVSFLQRYMFIYIGQKFFFC